MGREWLVSEVVQATPDKLRSSCSVMNLVRKDLLAESHKEGPVYGRIPYELGFLMILQAVKRILNIRFGVKAGKTGEKKKMQKNEKSS